MSQNLLFNLLLYKKKWFLIKHILIYHIRFKRLFDSRVWLPSSSGMTIYRNRPGQFPTLNSQLESFWSHCLVVSVQFLGNSGPSWVSIAPSSGHLDPLTIPLSFFRESKAVLASTIIFFEDTCVLLVYQMHYVLIGDWSTTSLHSVPFDSFIYA